jgi:hypothetical protein
MVGPTLRSSMELGDGYRKKFHQFDIQAPGRCQSVEECLLVKPIHHDDPIDRDAAPTDRKHSVFSADDR